MDILLHKLTKKEFYESEGIILFDSNGASRCFGVITNKIITFRLAWQSDLIDPLVTKIDLNTYSVGIDQNFAIINFDNNSIEFTIKLTYNFFSTSIHLDSVYVITELEIIKIHRKLFKILAYYALPDYFEEMVVKNDSIEIKCAGGFVLNISD